MNTIEYYRGRAEAVKEVHELLKLIHSNDLGTLEQLSILSKHLSGIVERSDHYIDMELSVMEGNELLRG